MGAIGFAATGGRIQTWAVGLQACHLVFSALLIFWRLEWVGRKKARIISMYVDGMNSNSKLVRNIRGQEHLLLLESGRVPRSASRDSTSVFGH